jgi:hypothetical protein
MRWVVLAALGAGSCQATPAKSAARAEPRVTAVRVGARPADVAAGDLDGDGCVDLVVVSADSRDLVVLRGDGRGGFKALARPVGLAFVPHLVAIADLDNDGDLDAGVTGHDTHDIALFDNPGDGRLARSSTVAALTRGEPHNHGLVFSDVIGDNRIDILTANQNDDSVAVLLGSAREFAPAPGSPFAVGRTPYMPAVGDLDGDGAVDVAVAGAKSGDVTILRGDGTGALRRAQALTVPAFPNDTALVDVNGDAALDVVTTHANRSALSVLRGDGKGGFAKATSIASPHRGWQLRAGDVTGDGFVDLVTRSAVDDVVVVLAGDGNGGFSPVVHPSGGRRPSGAALADVDGDDRLEIIIANEQSSNVSILTL